MGNMYNPDISRIDRQIEDLQRIKANYQSLGQAPINNIINTQNQPIFEAKFTTENPSDIYVQNKTAFINLKNGILTIKEPDGEIKEYGIILPKDEKDIRIEQLERKIQEMEVRLNEPTEFNKSITNEQQPVFNDNGAASKSKSKNEFFKSSKQ
jgi:hypothetical protein